MSGRAFIVRMILPVSIVFRPPFRRTRSASVGASAGVSYSTPSLFERRSQPTSTGATTLLMRIGSRPDKLPASFGASSESCRRETSSWCRTEPALHCRRGRRCLLRPRAGALGLSTRGEVADGNRWATEDRRGDDSDRRCASNDGSDITHVRLKYAS